MPVLLDMLEKGSVSRGILAEAVGNCGEEGIVHTSFFEPFKLTMKIQVRRCSSEC